MTLVTKGQWNGYDTYILHSQELEVTLLPRLGNNVISIWDIQQQRHVIRHPDSKDLEFYLQKPYHFGIPMLIPPGRIRNGQFDYNGITYQLDNNTAGHHHIHGLHRTQSWCVSDIEEDEDGCTITTEWLTSTDEKWMSQFKSSLKLEMIFLLQGASFTQQLKVTNLGEHAFPFGMGYHSWFMLDGKPEQWTLKLPVEGMYQLDHELIPTGQLEPLKELEPLNSDKGLNLAGQQLDTLFRIGNQSPEALLLHRAGYGIRYILDPQHFKHWVLFTKGTADLFLCIEPYTWLPNAPNLEFGHDWTGLLPIGPGQTIETTTVLEVIQASSEIEK